MNSAARVMAVTIVALVASLSLADGRTAVELSALPGPPCAWTAEGNQPFARFGAAVGSAGDVNGDGYADLIVGATLYDNPEADEGQVFLYLGGPLGLPPSPAWAAEIDRAGAGFGADVAGAGDVNGDGYADLLVGAVHYSNGETDEGAVFLYHGSPSGPSLVPDWTVEGDQEGATLYKCSGAGDVNGDGYSDVIVAAIWYDTFQDSVLVDAGRAYLYLGGPSGLATTPAWTAEGDSAYSWFGYSLACAGDVNGDGYSDIIVGARGPHGGSPPGRAYVYYGSASGPSSTPDWYAQVPQLDTGFAGQVAGAGDVNGDGYSDVIIGASGYDNGQRNEGAAFVYLGGPSGLSPLPAWMGEPDQDLAGFGSRLAAGDFDGDGYSDVLVAAPLYDGGELDEGRVFAYYGGPSGLSTTAAWTLESDQHFAEFGVGLAGAGDLNGDGYSDIAVGARLYDSDEEDEGMVFVYCGERLQGPEPVISSIIDHPQDEGGKVIVSWTASGLDRPPNTLITHYSVWRRYQGGGTSLARSNVGPVLPLPTGPIAEYLEALPNYGWEYVGDTPASYLPEYAMTVPTYADSTASGIPYCGIMVMAHTGDQWTFWVSEVDSGYSVDNLAPECPDGLAGRMVGETQVLLSWEESSSFDLSHYAVYRGTTEDFVPGEDNLAGTTTDVTFADEYPSEAVVYYKVSAFDVHGNESPHAMLSTRDLTGVPRGDRRLSDALYQNAPNPFGSSTRIAFSIRKTAHVRLRVFDARGRLVRTLVDEVLGPSFYEERWDGRDDGGRRVAAGTYFYKLELPAWAATRKMVLVK